MYMWPSPSLCTLSPPLCTIHIIRHYTYAIFNKIEKPFQPENDHFQNESLVQFLDNLFFFCNFFLTNRK